MHAAALDLYVAGFRAWCDAVRASGRAEVDEAGVEGLLASADDPLTRLVVTDDRAYEPLEATLPVVQAGLITVFSAATRCAGLIRAHQAWTFTTPTAMICRDLGEVPVVPLASELQLRPVRRLIGERPDGVPLLAASAAAMRADPEIQGDLFVFANFLRSMPPSVRLMAAVDSDGEVRATAGAGTFDRYASVMFVNTDREWRRRGIGRAMTGAALRAARESGADKARLDASDAGKRIYLRLGFEVVERVTRFYRPAAARARPGEAAGSWAV